MADRYWVGGTGTWNTSSTTNWSASSGGASGASVPTAADSVIFDQAGTYTVTCTGALTCLDITVSAGTVTFATGTSPAFAISGSMSLLAGTVWSSTGNITFNATTTGKTITTNGVNFSSVGNIIFNGVGGGWTLGSALTAIGQTITVTNGIFDTSSSGSYAVACSFFSSSASNIRTINLNASTITLGGGGSAFNCGTITNLTFNAGTSQINFSFNGNISSGGLTFYNVAFTNTSSGNTRAISGVNTFNNLAITAPASAGVTNVTFAANQIINGTLSTTGTAGNRRVFFASATYGIGFTLTVNSAASLTDADFRDLYVKGTAAPISGTRIGNRGNCSGITFSTPKTVYWNGSGNWSSNSWASSSGGAVNTDNFPLPQDIAAFDNSGTTPTLDTAIGFVGTVNFSARTTPGTVSINANTVYGNWINGSGFGFTGTALLTFSGGTTQTITSVGKTFPGPITVDTYGGTVQLADALDLGSSNALTVTNGTFTTAGFAVTCGTLTSNNSNVRTISLGASTVTLSSGTTPVNFATSTNLTFNAGTSTIISSGTNTTLSTSVTYYNFTFLGAGFNNTFVISGQNTFNNLTFTAPSSTGNQITVISANQTINGTLTFAGSSQIRRRFVNSNVTGTQRTLTVNSLSADYCDFRDIVIAGAASGSSPTNAGDCGGNSGITFPASKTVYWNLAGTQNFTATGWATSSGGTPAAGNFPLAQDTAIFDNTGAAGTVTIPTTGASNFWNFGTVDASLRTSAMTLTNSASTNIYGDWKYGTGVTSGNDNSLYFSKNGTQTITSNGVTFSFFVRVANINANVQLADALSTTSTGGLIIDSGTFDAVTYNVTIGSFTNDSTSNTLKMGSGTWTLAGTGTVWNCTTAPTIIAGASTIVLSNTSTTTRTFAGGGRYYNKLTIGGATGTSTLTFTGSANTFGEFASTKTVAHTIDFGTTSHTFGKWSVTGTAGNVVTITGTTAVSQIAGPAVTGVDYLAMGTWGIDATSSGEFYAGANSTGTAAAPVYRTAAPAPRTLYWVGGTGNWSSTTKWSTSSGGASGAAIPTSLDSVNFDSASNATAYTATIDAGVTPRARCASFTMAGPLVGNVTWAGTVGIAFHGNVLFAATGITRSYTGAMQWVGNGSYTFTTNGLGLGGSAAVSGIGSTWTLGSAFTMQGVLTVTYGTFDTSSANNYSFTPNTISSGATNVRTINLNASTGTLGAGGVGITFTSTTNLTFNAGTSQINLSGSSTTINCGTGQTFYNVSLTSGVITTAVISGANTFNTFSVPAYGNPGIGTITFSANQTISTLTLNAGTAAAYRMLLASNTIGTTRTLTVGTLTAGAADIDFKDITIAGAAAPISGTRFGDCKGNSGITFDAAKTVYFRQPGNNQWGVTGSGAWSATSGGALDATMFPLAQDTAVFPAATYPASGSTTSINAAYNIGTIDMSLRTSNTMTLATGANSPSIYGNWINGTGITLSGTGTLTFAGSTTQQITSSAKTFTQPIAISSPSGSVTIQDAFIISAPFTALAVNYGTFNANNYNVTLSNGTSSFNSDNSNIRTVALGSGTWAIGSTWLTSTSTNLTVTGSATITMTSGSTHPFSGGGIAYSGITLNQGGAGQLTIVGNNTFANITNTSGVATTINLGNTTQTVGAWTAKGTAGNLLTITGTSVSQPATLIYTGAGAISGLDYVVPTLIRAYPTTSTWYAGANSTNGGSLGWIFAAYVPPTPGSGNGNFLVFF
jgi:hypothetical protein